jgi:drug/metabolite transporter (DMT)-like permease
LLIAVLVAARILTNSFANVFQKKLAGGGMPSLRVNFLTYLGLSVIALIMACGYDWTAFSGEFWLFAVLTGICGALGNGFLVMALKDGELSVLGPVNAYKAVVAMLGGLILLREVPGLQGLAGMALIIGGSYLVLDASPERFSLKLLQRRDIQFRFYALCFTALEAVMLKRVISCSSPEAAFIIWCVFGAFFAFFLSLPVRRIQARTDWRRLLALILCAAAMQLSTNYLFKHMEVSYALSLFQLSLLLNVWLGYRFFRERELLKKTAGAVVMLIGSVLIICS